MPRPDTREANISSTSINALSEGEGVGDLLDSEHNWDPAVVKQNALFYAGSRVYLCPGKEVGNPDALTPSEGLGLPKNREARTEIYKQKLEADKRAQVRSKMTKRERAEEAKKSQEALKLFKEAQPGEAKKKPKKPGLLPEVQKKNKGLNGLMDDLSFEDRSKWEQCTQAGCTFWRQVETREIRLLQPPFKGVSIPEVKEEKYPLGTGSLLYQPKEFAETRAFLVEKGMPLPQLVKPSKKAQATPEEIQERRRHYSARIIQRAGRKYIEKQRAYDELYDYEKEEARLAEEEAAAAAEAEEMAAAPEAHVVPDALLSMTSDKPASHDVKVESSINQGESEEDYGDDEDFFDEESAEVNAGDV